MYLRSPINRDRRRGTVLVLTCLFLTGVLFLTALAIDSGNIMATRRHAQNCADAAALAGSVKLAKLKSQGTTPTLQDIRAAVNLSAGHNNYTDGTNCTVTVNWPPTAGSFQNNNSVEVQLTFTYNNLVVSGSKAVTVRSVTSCAPTAIPSFSMILLDPTAAKSFWVNAGSLTLNGTNISMWVDSNNANAAAVEGSGSPSASATVKTVGGSSGSFSPSTTTGVAPKPDPYALLPVPSTTGLTTYTTSVYTPVSGNITLNPGYYPNGLYCINGGNVKLNPGLYYIKNGNFWINTPGTVTVNPGGVGGVTIYHGGSNATALLKSWYNLDCGIVLCPTNGNYTFTAPTSGTYSGISFFQGPTCTGTAFYDFWGTGQINVGTQYFPNSTLRCWARTGTINCNELVAKKFKLTGAHEIYGNTQNGGFSRLTWNASWNTNRPTTSVALVE